MSSFVPFKLFQLPILACRHVVRQMGLDEILHTSLCSKDTFRILKHLLNFSKNALSVELEGWNYLVTISPESRYPNGSIKIVNPQDVSARIQNVTAHNVICGERYVRSETDNKIEFITTSALNGLISIVDHIKQLYGAPVQSVALIFPFISSDLPRLVEGLDNPRGSVKRLTIEAWLPEDVILQIIRRLKSLKFLNLNCHSAQQIMASDLGSLEFEEMKVFGSGDAIQLLNTGKCPHLTIETSHLTNEDFNGYIEKWIAGQSPWIKHHTFFIKENPMLPETFTKTANRVLKIGDHNQTKQRGELLAAYDVESNGGVQATCFISQVHGDEESKVIDFVVWQ